MACKYAHLVARKLILCALCADAMCIFCVCAFRVQPKRISTCCVYKHALAGPLCCSSLASGCLRRATSSWTILGATASARTHATAHRARPVHIHPRPSHYRPPLLTVLVFRALSQRLPSDIDASSDSGSNGRAARGACVNVCMCMCALWAVRASGSAREIRAQFR